MSKCVIETPMQKTLMKPKMDCDTINPNHLLEVRTSNGATFKGIIESLKNVLNEANFVFSDRGLRVSMADSREVCASFLTLDPSYFDTYHCKEKMVLGVDINNFFRCIKNLKSSTSLSFIVAKNDIGRLKIVINNEDRGSRAEHYLVLRNLNSEQWEMIDNLELEFSIDPPEIESIELQSICRHFHSIHAKEVEIVHQVERDFDTLSFRSIGGDMESIHYLKIHPAVSEPDYNPDPTRVSGRFLLYFLKQFTSSATHLSSKIRVSIRQDNCLLLEYILPGSGNHLRYLLFQIDD